jgi:type III pantothenate kinase
MMFLAVDIGNTHTKFGLFKKEEPFEMVFHFPTSSILSGEHIEDELLPKLTALGDLSSITIASVVPKVTDRLKKNLQQTHTEATISVLTNNDIPLVNTYKDPEQVGIDRLLGSFAAYKKWAQAEKKPIIVIALGTATTFDCVNEQGEYLGGIITLGIQAGAEYLSQITAQLPKVDLLFPDRVLGRSTTESMQSGVMFGALAMIEGLAQKLQTEIFPDKEVIVAATGGLATLFENRTKIITYIAPHLVLEGIAMLALDKS